MSAIVDLAFPRLPNTSPAQLPGAKAMMPAMAAPALPMIAPLIVAGRMISGARHNPE
jgi:hypothetical protein